MRIADAAWHDVDVLTIRNCWRKARILPEMNSTSRKKQAIPLSSLLHPAFEIDPVAGAEKRVEAALDDLVAMGALQAKNRMDIESLLNPARESHVLTETSDQEIYQTIIDSIAACENMEISGGDDAINENDMPVEPRPTQRKVLKAVSTINKYIADFNNPIAHKLEALLGSFNRQL
jgi:hypothetical protein